MKFFRALRQSKLPKVFVIGRNKTGTTSIASVLETLGYRLGNQVRAELLLDDWAQGRFRPILKYCRSADAFQDIPFSLEGTYQAVDQAFPGSRFILTVRGNSQEWYESLTRFHTKIVGKGRLPTSEDLMEFPYRETGWLWRAQQLVYGVDAETLYDPAIYQQHYDRYNNGVIQYFADRPDDLLVMNLADEGSLESIGRFLGQEVPMKSMPHLNQSAQ